ncbi:hypothetical protein TSUD_349060 [Trifolium subterraneum]|uniref:Uncharacterized protein n=1 Tax=Trifolium subterraneum TaxID=3900 RepID=A0A2Z6NC38_TRISU|nr:hypothetical protein TSUD_349060 [Trifolium subterraneum]
MLIIPTSSVTERRGDVCCPTVKWTWTSCFGPCSTAQKWMSSTRWALRPSPEQESPKSSCSGKRMVTLVDRNSGDVDEEVHCSKVLSSRGSLLIGTSTTRSLRRSNFVEICRGGERLRKHRGVLRGIVAHLLRSMDVTWMDKPFHLLSPRVKAIMIALKCSSVGVMAEEQAPASTSNVDGDNYAWVADEPRNTVSRFSLNGGDGMFRRVQRPPADDRKACIPNTNRRICSKFQWGSFPMYQIAFEQMGYRLPFSDFEVAVFRYLHLTPSQLHLNSLAFEMTAAYLGFLPTIPLFFHAFHLQRSRPKGDAANKFGWVSLKQSTKLFEMFLESVRGFKDSYFFVKPLNSISWQSIIYQGPAKDATGAPLVSPDGRPIMEDYSRFPLSWRRSHYMKPASDFVYSTEELTVEELSNYEQMKAFVDSFPRKYYEDEEGNPILDDMGVPLTKMAFIDTKRLLACKRETEMKACFQEMSTIAAKLRKSKAAKEKRQAAVLGASSNADSQPRPAKIARVDQGNDSATGRVIPSSPKFVFPPAIERARGCDGRNFQADGDFQLSQWSGMQIPGGEGCSKGGGCPRQPELKQAKVNHAAYKEKYTLQAGLVTKLAEKETEAARLVGEKAELEGRVKDLTTEKDTLEGKVKELESRPCSSGTAPDADELVVDPNGEYKGFTRAALVSRIFELEGKELDVAKSSFDNAVARLMVLNPGVELVVEGASELKEVLDGAIVSPSPDEED